MVTCHGSTNRRFLIPSTRTMRADSPTSRVPVASAFTSSRVLEPWFPNAATSPINTNVRQGPQLDSPHLPLDSRKGGTTTMRLVCGRAKPLQTNDRSWVEPPCEVLMSYPACAASRHELTGNKTTNSLPTRYCTMMMSRSLCGPSWSMSARDVKARGSWQFSVPPRCSVLAYTPNDPRETCRLRSRCVALANDPSQDEPCSGNVASCRQRSARFRLAIRTSVCTVFAKFAKSNFWTIGHCEF